MDGTLVAAPIMTKPEFQAGVPAALFASGVTAAGERRQYAVVKDGNQFLMIVPATPDGNDASLPLTVVVNWLAAVRK